jgi:hypothetical protein
MKLFRVNIDWSGSEVVYVLAPSSSAAVSLAMEDADPNVSEFVADTSVREEPMPSSEEVMDAYLISEESNFDRVGDWWEARDLSEAELALKRREELEALGQERLPFIDLQQGGGSTNGTAQ